ncbi:MAG: EAL domain-containing protein [Acidobacteriia bacterium]|nr:EAL domain-containing protein [Terriglobia bacterium]
MLVDSRPAGPDRLLIVDDDERHRELLSSRLEHRGYFVDVADDGSAALEKIQTAQYDLVLLDQKLPGLAGLDLLNLLRATYSPTELPVIMVTSSDQGVAAFRSGVNDFFTKPVDSRLIAARVEAELTRARSEKRARETDRRIDPVTGLGNRLWMRELLDERSAQASAFAVLGLDRFKVTNDSFGHAAGDRVLAEIGARLRNLCGEARVARIGGDEFAALIDHADPAGAAQEILAEVARPMRIAGHEIAITASLGLVSAPSGTPEDILRDADLALDRAKDRGRDRWHLFEPEMRHRALTRMELVRDMRHAVDAGQLVALYQSKVNLRTRRIVGFEALLRWQHPQRGLIMPADFIPLAEETGWVVPFGEWILREACRQLRRWQEKFPDLTMNVNLSVNQLRDPALVERVRGILEETGIRPRSLKLELTESALMSDIEAAAPVLRDLQALDIGLKLDDFGTGYSSLACLRAARFDSLKIDRSFVARMTADKAAHVIVDTVIRLAHALGMTTVAEGIEEEHQIDELIRLGCDTGQGFFFSRPVSAEIAEAQLAR